ncbi:MAG: sodium:glutamate symporter [Bacteroidales bacterium]|jgi:ESS family glutamate:Na+ symporter|nr:sodium:glutamate symporter [Bacteroidales bacterium]
MFNVDTFSPWVLLTDLGIISGLLLIGQLIRAKVKIIQQLFIPPSLLAGLLGLAFGPNGLDFLPLSNQVGTYAAVLIALVFGVLPLSSPKVSAKEVAGRVGPMWAYAQLGMLLQWALAGLFGLFVLKLIWPELNDSFGIMLSTGFYGGHGTAAAIGNAYANATPAWEEAQSLGMTTATVGVVCAIIGGLMFIKWATKNKQTAFISDFAQLPNELRTGLIPRDKRESSGDVTTSSISIECYTFHMAIAFFIAFVGYAISVAVKGYYPKLELPVFSCAFVVGLLFKKFMEVTKSNEYLCTKTTQRLGSMFTDILVACGVAAIKLGVVVKYALPLIVLVVFGVVMVCFIVFFFGKRLSKTYWFERSIFAWGWWTGTMAMGIALIRIVDPKLASKAMDDFALAYLPIAPVEILLITFVPVLFINGMGLELMLGCLLLSVIIIFLAHKMGWWIKKEKTK